MYGKRAGGADCGDLFFGDHVDSRLTCSIMLGKIGACGCGDEAGVRR